MVAIALAHDEGEPPDERFDPLSASSVPASAFEEIAATGQIGHLGFALLLSSVQRVGRRHRYPTPKGHQAWNPDAASEWLSDEFFPRKGVDILSTIKLTVVDEGGLERVLKTAIQNVFRDQARMSPVGKLMPRVRGILQKIPELLDATKLYAGTRAWTIDSNGDRIFSGDWADLLFAPRLRTLTQLERLNPSGPTSAANIARFKDAAIFLLDSLEKPSCTGSSSLGVPSPSTVVISCPSAWTASIVQDFTGVPSTSTVHAPQLVVSHPRWVPVNARPSRNRWASSSRGSTSTTRFSPLTVIVIRRSSVPTSRTTADCP